LSRRLSWSARGHPLLREALPGSAAAAPVGSSHGAAEPAARRPDLVRECLLRPPQPDRLYVVQPGRPEGRVLRKARTTHRLDSSEVLIAVWPWGPVMGLFVTTPGSLAFTSHGIRIAEGRLRLHIPFRAFDQYTFSYKFYPGGRSGPDVCELSIDGPTPWRSPNADQSAALIAADLTRIKELGPG
jgi:hypothetical protein